MDPLIQRMDRLEIIPNALGFYFLGQVSIAIRGPDGVIYIDPYLTDHDWGSGGTLPRRFPAPLEPHAVTNASGVLVSHAHADHFDPRSLGPIAAASPGASFVSSYDCDFESLGINPERIHRPAVLETVQIGSARITTVPSAHYHLEPNAEGAFKYLGFIIEWNGMTVYHAGDTILWDGSSPELTAFPETHPVRQGLLKLLRRWRIDVAFLPVNGRNYFREHAGLTGNLDPREAAHLAEALDIGVVVPTHYDLFAENSEQPGRFVDELYALNHLRRSKVMRPGELYYCVVER